MMMIMVYMQYYLSLSPTPPLSKVTVKKLVHNLENYHQSFYPLLQCLHHLTRDLPDTPLGGKVTNSFFN